MRRYILQITQVLDVCFQPSLNPETTGKPGTKMRAVAPRAGVWGKSSHSRLIWGFEEQKVVKVLRSCSLDLLQKTPLVANRWCPKCWLSRRFPRRTPARPSLQGLPLLAPCPPTAAKLPSQAPASTRTWFQSLLWPPSKYENIFISEYLIVILCT